MSRVTVRCNTLKNPHCSIAMSVEQSSKFAASGTKNTIQTQLMGSNYLTVLANFWLMREVLSHVGCYHFDLTMEWLTLSLICFPFQVHLTPLANMDRLYCFISFVACACLPYWYSVLTFQQPTQMCCFGVRWSTIGLLTVIISCVLMACNTSSPSWSIVVFLVVSVVYVVFTG